MKPWIGWTLAGAALAAAAAAVVVGESNASASTTPPVPPPTQSLIQGHRYTAILVCPIAIQQPIRSNGNRVAVVSAVMPAAGQWTIVFDYLGPTVPLSDALIWTGGPASSGCAVTVTDMGVSPPPLLQLITDPATVRQYQTIFATAIANGQAQSFVMPNAILPTTADYAMTDVDGNPANVKWTAILSAFQQYANAALPSAAAAGKLPAGYPSQLRTDGVLDYATAMAVVNG